MQSEATVMTDDAHVQSTELNRTNEIQTDPSANLNQGRDRQGQSNGLVASAFVINGGQAQFDGLSVTNSGQLKPVSDEQRQCRLK